MVAISAIVYSVIYKCNYQRFQLRLLSRNMLTYIVLFTFTTPKDEQYVKQTPQ